MSPVFLDISIPKPKHALFLKSYVGLRRVQDSIYFFFQSADLQFKGPLLYQHGKFYRGVSRVVIVNGREKPSLNK